MEYRQYFAHGIIFNDVEAVIQLLHDNNFVFADLRAPNILIINAT